VLAAAYGLVSRQQAEGFALFCLEHEAPWFELAASKCHKHQENRNPRFLIKGSKLCLGSILALNATDHLHEHCSLLGKGYTVMKAVIYKSFGPPDVLKLVNHPLPQRSAGEVLVKIKSTSVNPVDYKIRKGSIPIVAKKEKVLIITCTERHS